MIARIRLEVLFLDVLILCTIVLAKDMICRYYRIMPYDYVRDIVC